jgi:ribonuclease P protein component
MQALCGAAAFDEVFRQGRRISSDAYSTHFALHYLKRDPTPTECEGTPSNISNPTSSTSQTDLRLGFIVSKRLSKHSSRRNLIRRVWKQALQKAQAQQASTQTQALIIRQRMSFAAKDFYSPASSRLSAAIAQEAQALITQWLSQTEAGKLHPQT